MDIYLVPAGRNHYGLYCEVDDRRLPRQGDARPRWREALSRQFHRVLAFLEAERRERLAKAAAAERRTRVQRIRDRVLGWLAERVAEQRLLWFLRSERAVTAHHPGDMPADDAERWVRSELRRDSRRHLFWMFVNAGVYLASLPLTPIPGPNVLSLYFSFRAIGHFLSWGGARAGLRRVDWAYASSGPLTELRRLPGMKPADQAALALDVASRLNLRHLDRFIARMALAGP
jgi:Mitochondrial K+-H+ exchange-related